METSVPEEEKIVAEALARVLSGEVLDEATLYKLAEIETAEGRQALIDAAARITQTFCSRQFDSCSIVNARSGRCSEDCKWCAQSGHYKGACETYDIVDHDRAIEAAEYNSAQGIRRFSLVASGKRTSGRALAQICDILREVHDTFGTETCASLGLLSRGELQQLYNAGARRYHCNLETAPSYFGHLCTTHTQQQKLDTIEMARNIGFAICSGGIIGMGETRRQRVELAIELRKAHPVSIPINILSPIPGTPLEDTPLISEEEIVLAVALFRFAHPRLQLRFAGGRARLSREGMLRAMYAGINGGIMGDLLTTLGNTVAEDKTLIAEAGYEF